MSVESKHAAPRIFLSHIEAQLIVADVKRASEFYTDKLGFTVAFTYGEPPFYCQVVRDNARINLQLVPGPVFVEGVREREHLLSASIAVQTSDEIKSLFRSYQAAGLRFHQALKDESWGATTFIVMDPDGNLILFAGPSD